MKLNSISMICELQWNDSLVKFEGRLW